MDFEHAIKMDVRNNPIVRELDQARQRELWRSMLIGGALVAVILFSLWQRFSVMRVGTRIEGVQRELSVALEEQRRLTVEVERLSTPARIAPLARHLDMIDADLATTRIITRPSEALARGEQAGTAVTPRMAAHGAARPAANDEAHR
jgi:hypothetical protein